MSIIKDQNWEAKRHLTRQHHGYTQVLGERRSKVQLLFQGANLPIQTILTFPDKRKKIKTGNEIMS